MTTRIIGSDNEFSPWEKYIQQYKKNKIRRAFDKALSTGQYSHAIFIAERDFNYVKIGLSKEDISSIRGGIETDLRRLRNLERLAHPAK